MGLAVKTAHLGGLVCFYIAPHLPSPNPRGESTRNDLNIAYETAPPPPNSFQEKKQCDPPKRFLMSIIYVYF